MANKVDVLAVMDRDCFAAAQNRDDEGSILPDQRVRMFGESREARAAVAELIVRADNAATLLSNMIAARKLDERYSDHVTDLTAALARVQGDQNG